MISEEQARALLEECEERLGRPLTQIRERLAKQRDTLGTLWELIVLYVSARAAEVDHEPEGGVPDVLIRTKSKSRNWLQRTARWLGTLLGRKGDGAFWIEATHVQWKPREESDRVANFLVWIRHELSKAGMDPRTYRADVRRPGPGEEVDIPPENEWARIRRDPSWKAFVGDVGSRSSGKVEISRPGGVACLVSLVLFDKPSRCVMGSYAPPKVVHDISHHPVYKAIKRKATQAKKWSALKRPLVVCVGSSLSVGLFSASETDGVSVDAAVLGAFYDTSKWHVVHQHNMLKDTSGRRYRTSGVSRISAVVVVSIEHKHGPLPHSTERHAVSRVFVNEQAKQPLAPEHAEILNRLNFNAIPYGPQWEDWARGRADDREVGKIMKIKRTPDGGFYLEIPAGEVSRLLAGQVDAETLFRGYEMTGVLDPDNPPQIIEASVVEADAREREAPRVSFRFGPPKMPLIKPQERKGKADR